MKLVIAIVGKPRDRFLASAIAEYEARAARYWPLAIVDVRQSSGRGVTSDEVRAREGTRLLERVREDSLVVACDEGGEPLTSIQLARVVNEARERARDLVFIIGGAFGLSDAVRRRANRTIQLAPFTLPHELARLVLTEQLYRAGTIVRGEPYHK